MDSMAEHDDLREGYYVNRLSITFDDESLRKLNKICKKMNRTKSDTLRQLVKEYNLK